jgi:hypothetical protein
MKNPAPAFIRRLMLPLLLATGCAHAEPAQTMRAVELQAQAQSDASTLATLPPNTKVDVLRRSGAWSEIKTASGQTGWVRMFSLKLEPGATAPTGGTTSSGAANPIGALGNLLASGRSTNTATVTTGVRGLSEEDLKNAQANPAELGKMQKFATDKAAAQAFAQHNKLTPAKVDYLPEPAPVRTESPRMEGG